MQYYGSDLFDFFRVPKKKHFFNKNLFSCRCAET